MIVVREGEPEAPGCLAIRVVQPLGEFVIELLAVAGVEVAQHDQRPFDRTDRAQQPQNGARPL